MHVLLLDDLLVLLQRQEERLVLRCHSRTITPTPDGKQMLSPIIKLSSAMTREVATGGGQGRWGAGGLFLGVRGLFWSTGCLCGEEGHR